jgi:hypothetical protein
LFRARGSRVCARRLYRPGESPRKLASTENWGSAASPREVRRLQSSSRAQICRRLDAAADASTPLQLFFSSHEDRISAETLVHCAVVRFMPQPPAAAPTGSGFFVARVYDPASCNVHNLNSGNFRPEAFAAEISFIFEGPGKNRALSAGAALSDALAGTPTAAKPPAAAPRPAAPPQAAHKAAAAPEVIQKQRGAPPPEAHTVAATLRESLRRESTQAGRMRLLNQVASQSAHVRGVLASGDAAASICAWMQLAIKQTPLGGGGGESANALLGAALKALDALPLERSVFAAHKGEQLIEAARTCASTPTVAAAHQKAAGALVLRWRALAAAGDDAPPQDESQSAAAARAAAFGASPRSTEAAATLVGVARRASGAKTPASNGSGGAAKTLSVKRAATPAEVAPEPADDDDAAMAQPPPSKRAKGASPAFAAAGDTRVEAAAVRAATAAIAAGGGAAVNSAHKRAAAEKVEDALTAVALALKLSRAARLALVNCDEPAAEMGTLVEVRPRLAPRFCAAATVLN